MFDWILAVSASISILVQGCLARRITGTWLAPAGVFALLWFLYTFVPLILFPEIPINPWAIVLILLLAITISASGIFFNWRSAWRINRSKVFAESRVYRSSFLRGLFYLLTGVTMAMFIVNSYLQGFSMRDLLYNLLESANQYMERRYAEQLNENIYYKIGIVLAYLTTCIGGLLTVNARSIERGLIVTLSFLPPAFVMVTQSARGMLFMSLAFFLGSFFAARISANNLKVLDRGALRRFAFYGLILIPLVSASFLSRVIYSEGGRDYLFQFLRYSFGSYSSGHLFAFSDWLSNYMGNESVNMYEHEPRGYGFFTFMTLFRWFGSDRETPLGVYDEYFRFEDILQTNIYTAFRGLIVDFGLIGTLIFAAVAGYLFHLVFYGMLILRRPVFGVVMYIFIIVCLYISFGISILTWSSPVAALLLLGGSLAANRLVYSRVALRASSR